MKETEVKQLNKFLGAMLGGALMMGALALPATTLAADKAKMVVQISDANPAPGISP